MKTFSACHSITGSGVIFHGWPDGQPYLEQDAVVVDVFDTVKDELAAMHNDEIKKATKKSRRR